MKSTKVKGYIIKIVTKYRLF